MQSTCTLDKMDWCDFDWSITIETDDAPIISSFNGYKLRCLESLEVMLKTLKRMNMHGCDKYEQMDMIKRVLGFEFVIVWKSWTFSSGVETYLMIIHLKTSKEIRPTLQYSPLTVLMELLSQGGSRRPRISVTSHHRGFYHKWDALKYDRRQGQVVLDFKEFQRWFCGPLGNDSKNIIPSGGFTLFGAKATEDEAVLWHEDWWPYAQITSDTDSQIVTGQLPERIKISTTNVIPETTMPQKEETFQVIIDVIMNSTCYKAFTVFTEVPEIFMQQFWYTIKKKILDICPRVQGVEFTKVPDDETTFTFLIDLGYKESRGKGSQGKKAVVSPKPISDKESDKSNAKPARKRASSRRNLTLAPKEQLAANTMQVIKASKKSSIIQSIVGGSSKRTGVSLGVHDESTIIPATSSEGTGTKPVVPDEEKVTSKANVTLKWGSQQESEYTKEDDDDEKIEWVDTDEVDEKNDDNDDKSINLEKTNDEETDDEFVHGEEHVQEDDEENNDEKGDEDIAEAAKADVDKTKEAKDDIKEAEFPPLSSSL
ncbi:hypothetical protein Tco_0991294 [Tanacetum coccineum]|uniref:Uncharacterized protein n=1 Tax=Tanacetum coccineum TaxID=301880 RepID=A0ABQ5EZ55_9ASTR